MHKAYILIGLPGSGKSTLRNEMIAEGRANRYLNKDDIRESFPHASEREIHNHFISELEIIAIGGRDIILDNTHLNKRTVNQFRGILERNGYDIEEIVLNTSVEECIRRDILRRKEGKRYVGRSVIIRMAMDHYPSFTPHLGFIGYNGKDATIWDLDGTLCNITHRRHHVLEKPKNWKLFFEGIKDDTVNEAVEDIYHATNHTKILVSGRGEEYRRETEEWLERNGIDYFALFMRNFGDHRDDTIVKREIHDKYLKPYFDIKWIVDDRKRVVDMWRGLGYTVFHCDEGDF